MYVCFTFNVLSGSSVFFLFRLVRLFYVSSEFVYLKSLELAVFGLVCKWPRQQFCKKVEVSETGTKPFLEMYSLARMRSSERMEF